MKRKHSFSLVMVFCAAALLLQAGCSQPTSQNSKEAINVAQTIESQDKKVDYLYQQAQNFIGQEEYSEAKQIAEYILTKLDADSEKGKDLMVAIAQKSTSSVNAKADALLQKLPESQ